MAKKRKLPKLQLTDSGTLPKADVLERWYAQPANKQLNPTPVPYGTKGSSYFEDSIRVTGSLAWIDAVMSARRGLLRHENTKTLLDIDFSEQTEKGSTKRLKGKYTLYVKVKERARTTRAKSKTPAATKPRAAKPAAPAALSGTVPQSREIADALAALGIMGMKATEASKRLEEVVERHGKNLTADQYIKLAFNKK